MALIANPVRYSGPRAPLPENYHKLNSADQRMARLNAYSCQDTPDEVVSAWSLFREINLHGTRKREHPSPPLHYQWIWTAARYARNMIAAPRSFAKSTVVGKEWPLFLALTRPGIEILIVVSTRTHANRRAQWFMEQIQRNDKIKFDFGDMQGNYRRDGRMWNLSQIDLKNGSRISISTVGSIHLGTRPDFILLDDAEPDPAKVKDWEQVVSKLHSMLFDVFLPMLDAGTAMLVIGTLLHRRSWLYWCMTTSDTRLKFWHRTLSAIRDRNGKPEWPEKFPEPVIRRLQAELKSKFWSSFMNEPMSDSDCILRLHPRRNIYSVIDKDTQLSTEPLLSNAKLVFHTSPDPKAGEFSDLWKPTTVSFGPWARGLYRFMCVDYAEGLESHHDYSALHVMGLDADDRLWSLDLDVCRDSLNGLSNRVWNLIYKWAVRQVGIESVAFYKALCEKVYRQRGEKEKEHGWIPRISNIRPPAHVSKESRISGLEWRFDEGRVLIPDFETASYKMLRRQIELFTPDNSNNANDDAIDSLAMHSLLVKARVKGGTVTKEGEEDIRKEVVRRLVRGEVRDRASGVPLVGLLGGKDEIPYREIRDRQRLGGKYDREVKRAAQENPKTGIFTLRDVVVDLRKERHREPPAR